MFNRREKAAARIDTLIGRTASVLGDIELAGGLHVDGRITGTVQVAPGATASLSVSEHGIIEGSVEATQVVVNGTVNGDIHAAERVILGARARVRGNVSYGVIEMAMGAEISGKLMPAGAAAPGAAEAGAATAAQPGPSGS